MLPSKARTLSKVMGVSKNSVRGAFPGGVFQGELPRCGARGVSEPAVAHTKSRLRGVHLNRERFFLPGEEGALLPSWAQSPPFSNVPIRHVRTVKQRPARLNPAPAPKHVTPPSPRLSEILIPRTLPLGRSGHVLASVHGKALQSKRFLPPCRMFWGILTRANVHPHRHRSPPHFRGPSSVNSCSHGGGSLPLPCTTHSTLFALSTSPLLRFPQGACVLAHWVSLEFRRKGCFPAAESKAAWKARTMSFIGAPSSGSQEGT